MRRVVITGWGIVSPLGLGVNHVWNRLVNSESGIVALDNEKYGNCASRIAGVIPRGSKNEGKLDLEEWLDHKSISRQDDFINYGLVAADEAIKSSGFELKTEEEAFRVGVNVGSGIGGLETIYNNSVKLLESGPRRTSPFFVPGAIANLASGSISIKYGYKGPTTCHVAACASATHAIYDAFKIIRDDEADFMITGGAEAPVCLLGVAGFSNMKALSTSFNDDPTKASRPWDKKREGFVIAEGAGILCLEELEHAKKRGANILGEVIGGSLTSDANHISAPSPDGSSPARAIENTLKMAKLNPEDVGYVNAHGTSTPLGDVAEVVSIKRVFKDYSKLLVSSTKSALGHSLGATGGMEAIFSMLAINTGIIPPTLNLDNPEEGCDLNFVKHVAKESKINVAISNSFGFGGTNSVIAVKKFS